jgi:hypothetical protein
VGVVVVAVVVVVLLVLLDEGGLKRGGLEVGVFHEAVADGWALAAELGDELENAALVSSWAKVVVVVVVVVVFWWVMP